jgi:hypothetical protein
LSRSALITQHRSQRIADFTLLRRKISDFPSFW